MKLKSKNLVKGVAPLSSEAEHALNEVHDGLGTALNTIIHHLGNRADAQAGHTGTVGVAKQTKVDSNGRVVPGIELDNNRVAGVADPEADTDGLNERTFRRLLDCDFLMDILDDCLEIPEATGTAIPECWRTSGLL